jgi:hypothetical protein
MCVKLYFLNIRIDCNIVFACKHNFSAIPFYEFSPANLKIRNRCLYAHIIFHSLYNVCVCVCVCDLRHVNIHLSVIILVIIILF